MKNVLCGSAIKLYAKLYTMLILHNQNILRATEQRQLLKYGQNSEVPPKTQVMSPQTFFQTFFGTFKILYPLKVPLFYLLANFQMVVLSLQAPVQA